MNCQQFTSLIVESARGRLMDAAAREAAARHLETCDACAARHSRERSLTNALNTVAATMKDVHAPARVEEKLLAAFQESRAASHAATANALPAPAAPEPSHAAMPHAPAVFPAGGEVAARSSSPRPSWRTASRRQSWRTASVMATAIAASLALVALVTLYRQFTRTAPPRELANVVTPPRELTNIVTPPPGDGSPSGAPALATPSHRPLPAASAKRATSDGKAQPAPPAGARRTLPRRALAAPPAMIASRQVIDGGRAIFAEGEGEAAANSVAAVAKPDEVESVTEFIPLVAGAPASTPLEGGQLVRVQLPRAALASLGLPLNAERGHEERVSADVLLGNDGLARAIRFVR